MAQKNDIVIYKATDGSAAVSVQLKEDTVWLTQKQIAELFGTQRPAITKHLSNIFKSRELSEKAVSSILEHTAADGKTYKTQFYNLDAIISVGYKVNSQRATQFRIWANKVIKDYLVKGYALNEKRLKEQTQKQLQELQRTVKLIQSVADTKALNSDEATGLLNVITDYTLALDVLDKYDHQQLSLTGTVKKEKYKVTYEEAVKAIDVLRKKFKSSSLFGKEKDASFKSSVSAIYQTFGKKELYPSVEEKAANLLYFIVKNHSFVDGNKRIAAFIFVWFLECNDLLYRADGTKRVADNALVALTLLIAESKTEEKDMMVKVVVNLINRKN